MIWSIIQMHVHKKFNKNKRFAGIPKREVGELNLTHLATEAFNVTSVFQILWQQYTLNVYLNYGWKALDVNKAI